MADRKTQKRNIKIHKVENEEPILKNNVAEEFRNDAYNISCELFAVGGESQLYIAKRESDGKEFLAKIYLETSHSLESRNLRKDLLGLLFADESLIDKGILPVVDYGTIEIDFEDRVESINVDIIPYCEEGNLEDKKFSADELRKKVIPNLFNGLNYLHENGFLHRDIKPANIYMVDGKYVIGDFGTSVKIDSKSDIKQTKLNRGTVGYMAPEVRDNYATEESDYYSLGCTVATLYNGRHLYSHLLDNGDIGHYNKEMQEKGLVLGCPKEDEDIQILVDLLTVQEEELRTGHDDIKQWLEDSELLKNKWKNYKNGLTNKRHFSMMFEEKKYDSIYDLVEAFLNNWEAAKDFFYDDDMFAQYVKDNQLGGSNEISKIKKNPPVNEAERELYFSRFLYYFTRNEEIKNNPKIYWHGVKFDSLSDIAKRCESVSLIKRDEDTDGCDDLVVSLLESKYLSWRFDESKEIPDEQIQTIKLFEDDIVKHKRLVLFSFLHSFNKETFENSDLDSTIQEVLSKSSTVYNLSKEYCMLDTEFNELKSVNYDNSYLLEKLTKAIIYDGKYSVLASMIGNLSDSKTVMDKTDVIYLTLEALANNKKIVREHFLNNGRFAHIYWLINNSKLYIPCSKRAVNDLKDLAEINANSNKSISDNAEELLGGIAFYKSLSKSVSHNIKKYNVDSSVDSIKNNNSNNDSDSIVLMMNFFGFFHQFKGEYNERFDVNTLPIGFIYSIEKYIPFDLMKSIVDSFLKEMIEKSYVKMSQKSKDEFLNGKKYVESTDIKKLFPQDIKKIYTAAESCSELWEKFEKNYKQFLDELKPWYELNLKFVKNVDQLNSWWNDLQTHYLEFRPEEYGQAARAWKVEYYRSMGCCENCGAKLRLFSTVCSKCKTKNRIF